MIYGIGHDIVENARIEKLFNQYGIKLVKKILTEDEIAIYTNNKAPVKYLAKRFAAKEAFAKACGTGLRHPVSLANITVLNDNQGKPIFKLAPILEAWLHSRKVSTTYLSISDEIHYTSAFVVLEI
jgi:holo-[acyl-carrier protein] synthase